MSNPQPARLNAALRRRITGLSLSRVELGWLGFAALTAVVGVIGLLGVSEDVIAHNGLSSSDPRRLQFVIDHRTAWLDRAAETASKLGSAPFLAVLAVITAVVLYRLGKPVLVAVLPGLVLGIAGFVAEVLKVTVGRARPAASLQLVRESAPSFPSGHSTDSAAFYLAIGLVIAVFVVKRPWLRAVSVACGGLVAGLIGVSRLVLGVHWPSDVIAGLLLGTAVALTALEASYFLAREGGGDPAVPPTGVVALLLRTRRTNRSDGPLLAVA